MDRKTLFFIIAVFVFFSIGVVFIMNTGSSKIPGDPTDLTNKANEASFKTETKKVVEERVFEEVTPRQTTTETNAPTTANSAPGVLPNVPQDINDPDVKEFVIEAGSFYYKPNMIRVAKGDKVKITINSVSMMHDLNIEEYDVATSAAQSGKSASVAFTADKIGDFEMFCSIGQHRANGQVGRFIVE